jgi:hypothetical protein
LALAGVTIWTHRRQPAPVAPRHVEQRQPEWVTIEMADGVQWRLEQGPQESYAAFLLRIQLMAAKAAQREQQLLLTPPRER